jgi:hypothetical protein
VLNGKIFADDAEYSPERKTRRQCKIEADPPKIRSAEPNGVSMESKATVLTTRMLISSIQNLS